MLQIWIPRLRFAAALFLLPLVALLAGCGKTVHPGNPPSDVTLQSISLSPTSTSVAVGATQTFTATGNYSDGSTQNLTSKVTWAVKDSSVATVSASGVVTGVAAGSTTVNATDNGVSGSAAVAVTGSGTGSGGGTSSSGDLVYGTAQETGQMYGWTFASQGNALAAASGSPYGSGPGPYEIEVSPGGNFLYVLMNVVEPTVRGSSCTDGHDQVYAYSIDHTSGTLTQIQQLTLSGYCAEMAMDAGGQFLFVTESSPGGQIESIALDANTGMMALTPGSPYAVSFTPGAAAVAGNYLYVTVPDTSGPEIAILTVNSTTGAVQQQSTISAGEDDMLLAVSASGNVLYAEDPAGGVVTIYGIDSSTGALTQQGSAGAGPYASQITIDPTGQYVAIAAGNGAYLYTVGASGALTQVSGAPFGFSAQSVAFDSQAKTMFVAAQNSSGNYELDVYSLSGGTAQQVATTPVPQYLARLAVLGQ